MTRNFQGGWPDCERRLWMQDLRLRTARTHTSRGGHATRRRAGRPPFRVSSEGAASRARLHIAPSHPAARKIAAEQRRGQACALRVTRHSGARVAALRLLFGVGSATSVCSRPVAHAAAYRKVLVANTICASQACVTQPLSFCKFIACLSSVQRR